MIAKQGITLIGQQIKSIMELIHQVKKIKFLLILKSTHIQVEIQQE
jgi:hypothetical protein